VSTAERVLADSGLFTRRTARRDLADATEQVETSKATLDERTICAGPFLTQRTALEHEYRDLRDHVRHGRWILRSLDNLHDRLDTAQHTVTALNTWNHWASGHNVTIEDLSAAVDLLHESARSDHAALAAPIEAWARQRGLRVAISPEPVVIRVEVPTLEL